ncbi:MAG: hypothetical protein R3C18_01920 [Planctomycetaceae bacterium]
MNRQRCSSQCIEDWGLETAVADVGDTKSNCGYGAVRRTPSRNQNSRRGSRQPSSSGGKSTLLFIGGILLGGMLVVVAVVLLIVGVIGYSAHHVQTTLREMQEDGAAATGRGTDETINESTISNSQAQEWSPYERSRTDPLFAISNARVTNGTFEVDFVRRYAGSEHVTMVLRTSSNEIATADMGRSNHLESKGTFGARNSPASFGTINYEQGVEVFLVCGNSWGSSRGRKISNSLTYGPGMSISYAVDVPTAQERAAKQAAEDAENKRRIAALIASRVMPQGYVKVSEKTPLVVGAQVKVGVLDKWLDGEIFAVRGNEVDVHVHGRKRSLAKNSVPRSDLVISNETDALLTSKPDSIPSEICRYDVEELRNPPNGYAVLGKHGSQDYLRTDVPIMWDRDHNWCHGAIVSVDNERMVLIKLRDETEVRRVNRCELAMETFFRMQLMGKPNDPLPETVRPPEGFVYVDDKTPLVPGAQVMLSSHVRWVPGEVVAINGSEITVHQHGHGKEREAKLERSKLVISNDVLTQIATNPNSIVSEIAHTEKSQRGWYEFHNELAPGFTQLRENSEVPDGFPVKVLVETKFQDARFLRFDGTHMALVQLIGFDEPQRINRADIAVRQLDLMRSQVSGPNGAMPTRPGFGTAGFELPADHVRVADDLPLEPGMYVQLQTPNGWVRATVRKVEGDTISIDPDIPGAKRTDVSRKLLSVSERMEQLLRKRQK